MGAQTTIARSGGENTRQRETRLTLAGNPLWNLGYSYNLAGERLRQTSLWGDGGNSFEYELDESGRLIQESINRFVVNSVEAWAAGTSEKTRFDVDGKLRMVNRADDFQSPYLDLQRWALAVSEPVASGVQMRQDQGLTMLTSAGDTLRNGRHMPAGTPIDSSNFQDSNGRNAKRHLNDAPGEQSGPP